MSPPHRRGWGSSPVFAARLARREARTAFRRVGIFAASIALGVAALVTIHSFRADVARSLDEQALTLLGADARIGGNAPPSAHLTGVLDSLRAEGTSTATVTTAVSMVLAPRTDRVRLLQVKDVEGEWPFYGEVTTEPEGRWIPHDSASRRAEGALVDPGVLTQLGIAVGDTLMVGGTSVAIEGTVRALPGDLAVQTVMGPRVWIFGTTLAEAGLLDVGSLARHETFLRFPTYGDASTVWIRYGDAFREPGVTYTTALEQAGSLTDALDFLSRYLGLVGLGALLLGAIGVAGAVHVYVRGKLTDVAVLRCIGATQWTAFLAYLLQAAGLGAAGSLAGVVLGLATQQLLPRILGDVLPVAVDPVVSVPTVAGGMFAGLVLSVLFALPPLLSVRDVPPLGALRRDVEASFRRRFDPLRVGVYVLLTATVVGLSVVEAQSVRDGLAFAAGLAVVVLVLRATASLLARAARRFLPARAPYVVRQGVSNMFRPRNQTVSVTLALGFGAFVVGTVLQVQSSLSDHLSLDADEGRPDLILFDVQPDQLEGVLSLLPAPARESARVAPVVSARIAAIGGRTPEALLADTSGPRPARWALRREYRNTYRWGLTDTEEVVAGRWFNGGEAETYPTVPDGSRSPEPVPVSMEVDLAEDLGVKLGDTVTWDVGGRTVESVVTSFRRVEWDRFTTNFFVVFRPGPLDAAPQMAVVLARLGDAERRATLQGALVRTYPNVSALDLARVQEAVDAIVTQVDRVVRFLALFCAVAGLFVLGGALATSRSQRVRESALLRTLGARRRQISQILLAEYVAVGVVAAGTGLALALLASGFLVRGIFGVPFSPSIGALGVVWGGVTALTVGIGMLGSRGVTTRPPLPVLREAAE